MAAYTYDYGLGLGAPVQTNTYRITSWVGPRKQFSTSHGQKSSTSHAGVDIAVPVGTKLLAPMSGKVIHVVNVNDGTEKRNKWQYGNQVVIQRDDGVITQQSHLYDVNVKVGDRVQQGQVIGRTGNSGSSTAHTWTILSSRTVWLCDLMVRRTKPTIVLGCQKREQWPRLLSLPRLLAI